MTPTPPWKLKASATWHQKLMQAHPSHGKIVNAPATQRKKGIRTILIS